MILDKAIKLAEKTAKELESTCALWKSLADEKGFSIPSDYESCKKYAQEHRQLAEWLVQLKLITELVQEYADKETPEKKCEENDTCWGWEATTLIGKIADILKIDRCEEGENGNT